VPGLITTKFNAIKKQANWIEDGIGILRDETGIVLQHLTLVQQNLSF
jgi:hypothetical protein